MPRVYRLGEILVQVWAINLLFSIWHFIYKKWKLNTKKQYENRQKTWTGTLQKIVSKWWICIWKWAQSQYLPETYKLKPQWQTFILTFEILKSDQIVLYLKITNIWKFLYTFGGGVNLYYLSIVLPILQVENSQKTCP